MAVVSLTHRVSAEGVDAEVRRIEAALRAGGYDATGLDLEAVARAALARDLIRQVEHAGAHLVAAPWGEDGAGGLEIVFQPLSDTDLLAIKMALSD